MLNILFYRMKALGALLLSLTFLFLINKLKVLTALLLNVTKQEISKLISGFLFLSKKMALLHLWEGGGTERPAK